MQKKYRTIISLDEFVELRSRHAVVVFDCRHYLNDISRGRKEYLEGHIPGAVFMDIKNDLSSPVIKGVTGRHPLPDPEVLSYSLRAAGLNNEDLVLAYDQSNGAFAARMWWLLRWLGHEDVAVLDGGFNAWNTAMLPLDNQWLLPSQGNFQPNIQADMVVGMEKIKSLHDPLIDSRDYIRYTGEYEPIDPVAGHIPGAICIPYADNTDERGIWKPVDELKKRFADIESSANESPVFYCGSGVTACQNILAYKIATGKDSRLYPGSWSEWINYSNVKSKV